jgi:hypothetical protein
MARPQQFEDFDWRTISRPRRLTIGDLMFVVALAALGVCTITRIVDSTLTGDEQIVFVIAVTIPIALQATQWRIANLAARRARARSKTASLLDALAVLVAFLTFVCLFIIAVAFPQGAALVVVTMLVLVVYRATWD